MHHRNPLADPSMKAEIAYMEYDKESEMSRKEYVEMLMSRSADEVEKERQLVTEIRRLQDRCKNERCVKDDLIRTLKPETKHLPSLLQILSDTTIGHDGEIRIVIFTHSFCHPTLPFEPCLN